MMLVSCDVVLRSRSSRLLTDPIPGRNLAIIALAVAHRLSPVWLDTPEIQVRPTQDRTGSRGSFNVVH